MLGGGGGVKYGSNWYCYLTGSYRSIHGGTRTNLSGTKINNVNLWFILLIASLFSYGHDRLSSLFALSA